MWVTKFEIERTWCCLACWELCKPSANAVRPHLALVILSGSQEFSLHFCFHETPVGYYSKDQTEQAQSKGLRDHAKCHSNCRSPSSAHGMPQWNFRFGPIATDFCWKDVSCQVAGGCGKGQTFRHILPTVTLVVFASQKLQRVDLLPPFEGRFLTVHRPFHTDVLQKKVPWCE